MKKKTSGSLTQIVVTPDASTPSRIEFDIDMKEFAAIGRATMHWAFLEDALLRTTLVIAEILGVPAPTEAKQNSLRRRLSAFRSLVDRLDDSSLKASMLNLADRIAGENGVRQKLAHGIWSFDKADPSTLVVEVSRHERGPSQRIDVNELVEFGTRVSEITCKLLYPEGVTLEEIAKGSMGTENYFSRTFLRKITGSASDD